MLTQINNLDKEGLNFKEVKDKEVMEEEEDSVNRKWISTSKLIPLKAINNTITNLDNNNNSSHFLTSNSNLTSHLDNNQIHNSLFLCNHKFNNSINQVLTKVGRLKVDFSSHRGISFPNLHRINSPCHKLNNNLDFCQWEISKVNSSLC